MRKIVADTGPIFHLHEAGWEALLPQLGEIALPPAVAAELSALSSTLTKADGECEAVETSLLEQLIQGATVPLPLEAKNEADGWLEAGLIHRGEAEALALARHVHADWFLTDDAAARLLASQLGLETHGSLGVVLWAAATGRIDRSEGQRALNDLANTSLWISKRVLNEATAALDELYS